MFGPVLVGPQDGMVTVVPCDHRKVTSIAYSQSSLSGLGAGVLYRLSDGSFHQLADSANRSEPFLALADIVAIADEADHIANGGTGEIVRWNIGSAAVAGPELPLRDDAVPIPEYEQILVAGDEVIGLAGDQCLEHRLVVRVAEMGLVCS